MIIKRGFTLAEVLITLAVIGVVAAMSIPALMGSTNNKELEVAWKKAFTEVSQLQQKLFAHNMFPMDITNYRTSIAPYFNFTKSCTNSVTEGCWHQAGGWTNFANKVVDSSGSTVLDQRGGVTPDGMYYVYMASTTGAICDANPAVTVSNSNEKYCVRFIIDVNGAKGPNKIGRDIFAATMWDNKVLPEGALGTPYVNAAYCNSAFNTTQYVEGLGCSTKALQGLTYN